MIKQFRQIILVALRSSFFSSQYLFTRSFINSLKKTPLKILQLFLKTRHINQVFQKSQSKVPQNMPKKLPKTCPKVSKTCPKSYQIHAQIHVQKLPDTCPKVPQNMPKKFPKYAQKVPEESLYIWKQGGSKKEVRAETQNLVKLISTFLHYDFFYSHDLVN